jgi:nucleotide-binding universal stress UspA family protein
MALTAFLQPKQTKTAPSIRLASDRTSNPTTGCAERKAAMFEHILIPLDGSGLAECVLPHGLSIARALDARATILQVVEPAKGAGRSKVIDPLEWRYRQAEAKTYLEEVSVRLHAAGLPVEQVLLEGDPAERVIDHSQASRAGLIVLSSHGQSGLSGWNVSSVVQKILARARVSILLIPAYHPASVELSGLRYKRILVPLDGSQRAECVIPVVTALAGKHGSQAVFVHVVRKPELPRRAPPSQEEQALADSLTDHNRREAGRYLQELRTRLSLAGAEVRLEASDNVSETLQQLALDDDIDLVVLSAHGYSGGTRWSYGSVASSFILYGARPLLIIQDLPAHSIAPSTAELAAREFGHH